MFPFKTSLNASTLFPYVLDVESQIRVAADAGYEGIELWVRDIETYLAAGGSLGSLRRLIGDTGLALPNAIAFFRWADRDKAVREAGLEQAKREMTMLADLGCEAVAAPPFGDVEGVTLEEMAEAFARLAKLGRDIGIEPYLEFWGRAKRLSRLSEAVYVAMESGVGDAKILLDPFHLYAGGSKPEGLACLNGRMIGIVHANDYPSEPDRARIADRDRVFPGEGTADSRAFAKTLHDIGYRGFLSLELFQEDVAGRSAAATAAYGLGRIRAAYDVEIG
ncbi:TIM barrel protein [Cohnella sp. CFH 77786]|uniref:sugar phosphate isomerase/epimerase family protein n=1 Tax=Cohnella sp. CFH 77786 TaxID=2662265 RepID=UPI001C60D2B4|nr:sugar phosphate isomerase/epimerase family protein [Cohnella sp. CFH 77786]MBW5446262.1 TIM barrel protein [Cohnella sp. CFH 77786]